MASFSVLTAFWIIKTSQVKERSKEKQRGKASKVKWSKEDSSYSLISHFWSTYRSPFFACYIPFQSLGSQESNASKPCTIWSWNEEDMAFGSQPLQVVRKFCTTPCVVRNSHNTFKIRTANAWCEFCSAFADSTLDIFLCIFWCNFLSYPCK